MTTCVIVDDNRDFLRAAQQLLETAGMEVIGTASDAVEAIATVASLRPDVTLLDVNLGDESGFDVADRLSQDPTLGRPAMIMLSTYSSEVFGDLVESGPALGFLSKATLSASDIEQLLASRG
jgi:CheY-like chemotaxis protein